MVSVRRNFQLPTSPAVGAADLPGSGRVFYATPSGQLITPPGYLAKTALNGKGLVLLPKGQALTNNANIIRWGDPNKLNPNGYFRYYDAGGAPINPRTGLPTGNKDPLSHIGPDYSGPWINLPGK